MSFKIIATIIFYENNIIDNYYMKNNPLFLTIIFNFLESRRSK
jgi:hypothetical protein